MLKIQEAGKNRLHIVHWFSGNEYIARVHSTFYEEHIIGIKLKHHCAFNKQITNPNLTVQTNPNISKQKMLNL